MMKENIKYIFLMFAKLSQSFLIYHIHLYTAFGIWCLSILSFYPTCFVLQLENEQNLAQRGHARRVSRCFAFPYNIRRVLVDGRGRITSTGMVFAPAAIRNAICGVFAAQKITAVSSNEPCTRDLGRAR